MSGLTFKYINALANSFCDAMSLVLVYVIHVLINGWAWDPTEAAHDESDHVKMLSRFVETGVMPVLTSAIAAVVVLYGLVTHEQHRHHEILESLKTPFRLAPLDPEATAKASSRSAI